MVSRYDAKDQQNASPTYRVSGRASTDASSAAPKQLLIPCRSCCCACIPAGRVCCDSARRRASEPGVEVWPCVEATEGLQMSVEFFIRRAHALTECSRPRSIGRARYNVHSSDGHRQHGSHPSWRLLLHIEKYNHLPLLRGELIDWPRAAGAHARASGDGAGSPTRRLITSG
jgi:hypothetical protein